MKRLTQDAKLGFWLSAIAAVVALAGAAAYVVIYMATAGETVEIGRASCRERVLDRG